MKTNLAIFSLFLTLSITSPFTYAQFGNIRDSIGDAANDIGNAAEDVGNEISNAAEDVGNNIGNAAEDVGNDVSSGFEDVRNSLRDRIDNIVRDAGLAIASEFFGGNIESIFVELRAAKQGSNNNTLGSIQVMDIFNDYNINELCNNCQELVSEVREHGDNSVVRDALKKAFEEVCEENMDSAVCSEYVRSFGDIIIDSMEFTGVTPNQACQSFAMCPSTFNETSLDPYVQEVLQGKPAEENYSIPANGTTYTVLHITDIHLDFLYQEGTDSNCGGFQCCRAEYGTPADPANAAGYWGSLGTCDIPVRTFEQFVQFVQSNFNLSMIIWTGDNTDHQLWDQFQFNQTVPTLNITQKFIEAFPNTTAIYPMFGNHENFPSDQYDTVGNDSAWLNTETADMWEPWFDEEAFNTFEQNSYYSEVNTEHNVKIISLDTQTCDTLNFYLIRDTSGDPLNQLDWLQQELADAENRNLTVFIMGHIPPGSLNCDPEWSAKYKALVDRFSNTIKAQFYGHTHNDQFQVVRSETDDSPVGTIYVAPSLSTYIGLNPSFRIYEFDSTTNEPVNYYQYRLNLTKWNSVTTGPIEFDLAYNFLEEYDLPNMSHQSFDTLADNITTNATISQAYQYNFNSGGSPNVAPSQRETDYNYCSAKFSTPVEIMECLGLDPAKTNLLYFAASYVPGLLTMDNSTNN